MSPKFIIAKNEPSLHMGYDVPHNHYPQGWVTTHRNLSEETDENVKMPLDLLLRKGLFYKVPLLLSKGGRVPAAVWYVPLGIGGTARPTSARNARWRQIHLFLLRP